MSWRDTEIGLILDATSGEIQTGPFGTQLKASEYQEDGIPVINVRNIGYGDLRPDKLEYVGEIKADKLKAHRLEKDDIVFGRKGAVDRHLLVSDRQVGWIQGSDCIRLRLDPESALPKFVSYALLRETHKKWILAQSGNKATMASLNHDIIRRIPISLPDLPTQQRIAGVLSAYDDLIENNRRRIGLLEQAARLLYREWFVHLRFPGHETAKIVDGLPEGWSIELLSDLCVEGDGIQTGPFGSQLHQSDYTDSGVPVVMPKDMKDNKVDCDGIARIPESLADKLGRHRMMPGDTVYGRRGDIGRRAFIGKRQSGFFCGTGCLRIRPDVEKINARYLFETLGSPATAGFIANQAKGSTMPNLSAGALKKVPVLCAPDFLQSQFAEIVEPMFETAEILDEQVTRLTRARDLLLPRLMDGRIPV